MKPSSRAVGEPGTGAYVAKDHLHDPDIVSLRQHCPTLAGVSGKWSLVDGMSATATGSFLAEPTDQAIFSRPFSPVSHAPALLLDPLLPGPYQRRRLVHARAARFARPAGVGDLPQAGRAGLRPVPARRAADLRRSSGQPRADAASATAGDCRRLAPAQVRPERTEGERQQKRSQGLCRRLGRDAPVGILPTPPCPAAGPGRSGHPRPDPARSHRRRGSRAEIRHVYQPPAVQGHGGLRSNRRRAQRAPARHSAAGGGGRPWDVRRPGAAAPPGNVFWHPEITDHYRFALSRPELDGLLIAPATPNEVAALAEALKKGPLDEEEETYLTHAALVAQGHAKVEPECLTG